jgi:hypothetical protein
MKRRGLWIRACAASVLDTWTMERVVDPAIADLRHEPISASRYFAVFNVVAACLWTGGAAMKCSFCRRPDSQVEKLVAGPRRILSGRVYICDRCTAQTIAIMEHSGNTPPDREAAPLFRRIVGGLRASRRDDRHSRRAIVSPTA